MTTGICKGETAWLQKNLTVQAKGRGCHLITDQILAAVPELRKFSIGTFSVFIQHTSASLSINENADPTVRTDMEKALNMLVPESWATDGLLDHVDEGPDDITGHVKSTIVGANLTIPVSNGRLALGNWQGIYLCEHRNAGGFGGGHARRLVITVQGLLSSSAHKK